MAQTTDFIVIGGGIAGAAAGYELSRQGSVTLLEREATCGQHSTGRSAALFTECYGDTIVRRLAIASRTFLEHPPDGFATAPLLTPRSVLFTAAPEQLPALEAAAVDYQTFVPNVRRIDAAEATAMCPVLDPKRLAGGLVEPDAMDIDVHGLHQGFLAGIRHNGSTVRTAAGVTGMRRAGTAWTVETDQGAFEAPVVINAAGAWADEIAAAAGVPAIGLTPKRRTAFTFDPGVEHRAWPMVVDIDERFYFKPEGPHVLGSPADETPMAPCDVRHEEVDVAIGIARIEEATTLQIRHVRSAWAGLRSFVADNRPVVGEAEGHPGFYWLAGQGGYGIKTSPAMARAMATLIIKGRLPRDLIDAGITAADLAPHRLAPSRG